jgi:hypothetical protein
MLGYVGEARLGLVRLGKVRLGLGTGVLQAPKIKVGSKRKRFWLG